MSPSYSLLGADVTVLDASSLISLMSMPCVEKILTRLPNPSVVQQVQSEIKRWPGSNRPLSRSNWRDPPLHILSVLSLTDHQANYFTELVVECGLGDGEAASLALVKHLPNSVLICDDAKAARDGKSRNQNLLQFSTVAMMRSLHEIGALSAREVSDALRTSLTDSRLRIDAPEFSWARRFVEDSVLERMPSVRRLLRSI